MSAAMPPHKDCCRRRHRQSPLSARVLGAIVLFVLLVVFLSIRSAGTQASTSAPISNPAPTTTVSCSTGAYSSSCCGETDACGSAAPFIFDSLYSLLKQWPSTYGSNGHSVVPVTLQPNVPLYHAKREGGAPPKPTWFAFDAEMSLGIFASSGPTVLHTFIPTKPLTLLYFDGQSAVLTPTGALDSQDAVLHGHVDLYPEYQMVYNETYRGDELCQWAQQIQVDGFVRMNSGFETLICDYVSSGVKEAFVTNVTVPGSEARWSNTSLPHDPHRQPPLGYGSVFAEEHDWDWLRIGTWKYGSQVIAGGGGQEKRVELDLCGMVTFYNPALTSLIDSHHGGLFGDAKYQNGWGVRRGHRLLNVTSADVKTIKGWIQDTVRAHKSRPSSLWARLSLKKTPKCSGTNWQAVTETIVDSHRGRLLEVAGAFKRFDKGNLSATQTISRIQQLTHNVLATYLQYPGIGSNLFLASTTDTIQRCSALFTSHLLSGSFNEHEALLMDSIETVLSRICHLEWRLFEWSDSHSFDLLHSSKENYGDIEQQIHAMSRETSDLLHWIGWDLWNGCSKRCGLDEFCYIPMWPVIYGPGMHQGGIYGGSVLDEVDMEEFWRPRCVTREMWALHGGRGREPLHRFADVPCNVEPCN